MKHGMHALAGAMGLMLAGTVAAQQLDAKAADAIMNKAGCSACHSLDKKGVGPAYKEVAKKHKGKANVEAIAQKVRAGGSGVYGPVPMPPNPAAKISDDELKKLVSWIVAL